MTKTKYGEHDLELLNQQAKAGIERKYRLLGTIILFNTVITVFIFVILGSIVFLK